MEYSRPSYLESSALFFCVQLCYTLIKKATAFLLRSVSAAIKTSIEREANCAERIRLDIQIKIKEKGEANGTAG